MVIRSIVIVAAVLGFTASALAQSQADLMAQVQTALKNNNQAAAIISANKLYELAITENDFMGAGKAAFTRAKILAGSNKNLEAAKAYGQCRKHYKAVDALAQSLHCQYESGLAYLSAGKPGLGQGALESTARALEDIGQDKSGLAAPVYMKLSELVLPTKIDASYKAKGKRNASIRYANKAIAALEATGQKLSEQYVSALFAKGIALEDAENFEEAIPVFEEAISIYKQLPNNSKEILENARTHLKIARFGTEKPKTRKTITIADKFGNEHVLKVKKKKRVKIPRPGKNQIVDGARAQVQITLNKDGSVAKVDILKSIPDKAYGQALAKAIKTWKFMLPPDLSGLDIEPFEYGMTYYVKRL